MWRIVWVRCENQRWRPRPCSDWRLVGLWYPIFSLNPFVFSTFAGRSAVGKGLANGFWTGIGGFRDTAGILLVSAASGIALVTVAAVLLVVSNESVIVAG